MVMDLGRSWCVSGCVVRVESTEQDLRRVFGQVLPEDATWAFSMRVTCGGYM